MIGSKPLRIPNKFLENGDDTRYREDMETIERLVNSLSAPAASGFAGLPFDGIVDYAQTPDHAKGIYETPFTAINDICNNKQIHSPTIVVIIRQSVAPGFYAETANVSNTGGSTLNSGIKILCFFPQEPALTPQGWWDTNGHTCDLNGGSLWLEGADFTSGTVYPFAGAPFINCEQLTCIRVSATDPLEAIASHPSVPMNATYIDCYLALTFVGAIQDVKYYGGAWYGPDTMIRLNRTTNIAGKFTMIGTRILSPQAGNVRFGGSSPAYVFRSCTYNSPSELSSGTDNVTFLFNPFSYLDCDIVSPRGHGWVTIDTEDAVNPAYIRLRGSYLNVTINAVTGFAGTEVDIDIHTEGTLTVTAETGKIVLVAQTANHVFTGLFGATMSLACIYGQAVVVPVYDFRSCLDCHISAAFHPTHTPPNNLKAYQFDAACARNIFDMAGASQCTTAGTDAGVGNLIRTT